jgi:hypothetical protein
MRTLLVLLAMMFRADAESLSYLGLCNKTWDCRTTLAGFGQKTIITGWLEGSFGHACECADRILRSKKDKIIRVHLSNGPCMRNNRCQRHDVFWGYTVASANRAVKHETSRLRKKFYQAVIRFKRRLEQSRGALMCYVSPCLECDLGPNRKILFGVVRDLLPNCVLVDNPHKHKCIKGTTCEKHGFDTAVSRPCLYDLDGSTVTDPKVLDRIAAETKECDVRFFWQPWMNCNESSTFIPPSLRQCNVSKNKINKAKELSWNW